VLLLICFVAPVVDDVMVSGTASSHRSASSMRTADLTKVNLKNVGGVDSQSNDYVLGVLPLLVSMRYDVVQCVLPLLVSTWCDVVLCVLLLVSTWYDMVQWSPIAHKYLV